MPRKTTDTLLGQTLTRAVLAIANREVEAGRDPKRKPSLRDRARVLTKATTVSSRVASLCVMWSVALADLERDSLGVEEYVEWSPDSRPTVYRHLHEFRELWPEYDTPNEIALLLLAASKDKLPSLSTPIPVNA